MVKDAAHGQERRVNLSSIRAPRLGRKGEKPEDWATEAKEFLRQRLIGQIKHTIEKRRMYRYPHAEADQIGCCFRSLTVVKYVCAALKHAL